MNSQKLYIKILSALQKKEYGTLSDLIRKNSQNIDPEKALIFLQSNLPYKELISLNSLASDLLLNYNYEYAEIFSRASLDRANEIIVTNRNEESEDFRGCIAIAYYTLLKIYTATARVDEGIELYESFIQTHESSVTYKEYLDLHLQACEMYLTRNKIETARKIIQSLEEEEIPASRNLRYNQIRSKIEQLTSSITDLPDHLIMKNIKTEEQKVNDVVNSFDFLMKEMTGSSFDLGSLKEELYNAELKSTSKDDKFIHEVSIFEAFYGMGGTADKNNQLSLRRMQLQKVLFDKVKGHSKPELEILVPQFLQLLNECQVNDYEEGINNILWSLHLCYSRLKYYKQGAEVLEKLKKRLEETRRSLKNINERAGVFFAFPHFYPCFTEMYFEDKQFIKLLETIEDSKGRNLADKALTETGIESEISETQISFDELRKILKKHSVHYLSIFTDLDWSYSILVTAQGKIIVEKITIGSKQLELWVNEGYANPNKWTTGNSGFFGEKVDFPALLTPFLGPLENALSTGIISVNDHIYYSPDGYMHLFPLHYIKLTNNRYLIEDFSLSKIHSSMQLKLLLSQKPRQIDKILTITTPAQHDDEKNASKFNVVQNALKQYKNHFIVTPTVNDVLEATGPRQLIHFATHGCFPDNQKAAVEEGNPYYTSGLLLCDGDAKPVLGSKYYLTKHLLSPKIIVYAGLDLKNSHVSMQACVSGQSKEGAAGDALGLEWAFFSCGVASLISANWNIEIGISNNFFTRFYNYWLNLKLPKSQAYRKAVLEMMKNERGELLNVFEWGGLTLSGDHR